MDKAEADQIIQAMGRQPPTVRCTRCHGIGIHKSGGGTRECFKCIGTGDISQGTGRSHPKWNTKYKKG